MEMRCREDIDDIGQDLTPPLYPIAFSLYDTHLLSHCSACFSPLSLSSSTSPPLYCSSICSSSDSPVHLLSAEQYLQFSSTLIHRSDSSDLRTALRLLQHSLSSGLGIRDRIGGLLSNRDALIDDPNDEVCKEIKEGAEAMAAARRMRDGGSPSGGDCVMEEVALSAVMTNAVEVQDQTGRAVGIAVYDTTFSWINHSCSPNASYRFAAFTAESPLMIAASSVDGGYGGTVFEVEGWERYGPRICVRNIKAINRGEELTIAYTDLLQAKETRQSDLWFKYRFICHCGRCSTLPLSYVDHALQDIHVATPGSTNLTSACNVYKDEAVGILAEYIDGAISEYVKFDDAKSCCEKLEHVLAHGLTDDQALRERKLPKKIRLQPLHHLSLNAYIALASAYKTLASNFLDLNDNLFEHQLYVFDKSRISAAYSLLLAGATHYLFLSESSLVISVANFWMAAGESLLSLASSRVENLSMDQCFPIPKLSHLKLRCNNCALKDKFEASFVNSHTQNSEFEHISRNFLNCVTDVAPQVWIFLIQGGHYLREIKNPIDFTWLENTKDLKVPDFGANLGSDNVERSFLRREQEHYGNQMMNIFQLGAHCLLYGKLVLKICCGKDPQLANLKSNLLHEKGI